MKKNYFSLIEIVISIFLISIILIFLFKHFSNLIKLENNLKIIKENNFQKSFLHSRLSYVFNQINIEKPIFFSQFDKNNKFISLNFEFDNGSDPSPNFSFFLNGKIYVNNKNELILDILSFDKKELRKNVLFKNIKNFKVYFYSLEDNNLKSFLIKNYKNRIFCYSFWPKDKNDVPSMLEIFINDQKFVFFVPKKSITLEY